MAAPLLDADGAVVGALYGERRRAPVSLLHIGGQLEATLVDLLACGVAAGLARQAKEKSALEAHVRLEQFFGADLARRLVREPGLLEGRDAEVTLLFCDVRGFSRVSEKLGPAGSLRWMNDVMNELSRCVLDEGGVTGRLHSARRGDGHVGGAAGPAGPGGAGRARGPGHACRSAGHQHTVAGSPRPSDRGRRRRQHRAGPGRQHRLEVQVQVRRTMGNTVNLGSRVQGLTKYLKCPVLTTRVTRERLGDGFTARRVVKARVVNIAEPVDLYEVEAAGVERRRQFFAESEAALEALEATVPTSPWRRIGPACCFWITAATGRCCSLCHAPAPLWWKTAAASTPSGRRRANDSCRS